MLRTCLYNYFRIERKKAQKDAEYASRIQEEQRAALKSKHELEEMKSLEENRVNI